jgi:hypothetical protein
LARKFGGVFLAPQARKKKGRRRGGKRRRGGREERLHGASGLLPYSLELTKISAWRARKQPLSDVSRAGKQVWTGQKSANRR